MVQQQRICLQGNASSIPGSGRSSGIGNGNPLQYSCLKNPMDRCTHARVRAHTLTHTHTHTEIAFLNQVREHTYTIKEITHENS